MEAFQVGNSPYKPLNTGSQEIRLLVIQPGPKSADIRCSLLHTSLLSPSPIAYEAVSYCWGDPSNPKTIDVDGHSINITQSAYAALRNFRHEGETRTVWIDAICINQSDIQERSAQVGIMKEIYVCATCTLVWLGEDEDGTFCAAVNLMICLTTQMVAQTGGQESSAKQRVSQLQDFEWNSSTQLGDIRTHDIPPYSDPAWAALDALFNRPWFTRTWVIQEITLSKHPVAFCGKYSTDWSLIQLSASWITTRRYAQRAQRFGLEQAKHITLCWGFADKSTLAGLLLVTRDAQATEKKDKIYGLLGLAVDCQAADGIPGALRPDYRRETSEVFADAARFMIEDGKSLEILSQIGYISPFQDLDEIAERGYPSWVPRWDLGEPRLLRGNRTTTYWGRPRYPYCAAGDIPLSLSSSTDIKSLVLLGMRIDRIASISEFIGDYAIATTDIIPSLWNNHVSKLDSYPDGQNLRRAFSLTMVADATLNKLPASQDVQHDCDFAAVMCSAGSHLRGLSGAGKAQLERDSTRGDVHRYRAAVVNAAEGRSFCTTGKGWMGICPSTARRGDLVVLLFGGEVLYVLREGVTGGGKFGFVGECFVQGRMGGGALAEEQKHFAPVESFELC